MNEGLSLKIAIFIIEIMICLGLAGIYFCRGTFDVDCMVCVTYLKEQNKLFFSVCLSRFSC